MSKEEVKEVKKKATPKKKVAKKPQDKLPKATKVMVEIGGEEYEVRFPVSALIKLKNEAGISISDLDDEETAEDLETIVALIWSGIVTEAPDVTREFLADNIEMHELGPISEKVVSVISAGGK